MFFAPPQPGAPSARFVRAPRGGLVYAARKGAAVRLERLCSVVSGSYDQNMSAAWRRGSDSRCCDPSAAPYAWLDYVDDNDEEVSDLRDWLGSLRPFARAVAEGEIDDLFDAAAKGGLEDSGDERTPIKPIREDPEIYELRHTTLSKKLRFYHGEPSELPLQLVAVHRHIKTTSADQQAQIEAAADRYDSGRPTAWTKTGA